MTDSISYVFDPRDFAKGVESFCNVPEVGLDDVAGLCLASRLKDVFVKENAHYLGLPFLDRMLSKKPVDPAPGYSPEMLRSFIGPVFSQAFPVANFTLYKDGSFLSCDTRLTFDRDKEPVLLFDLHAPDISGATSWLKHTFSYDRLKGFVGGKLTEAIFDKQRERFPLAESVFNTLDTIRKSKAVRNAVNTYMLAPDRKVVLSMIERCKDASVLAMVNRNSVSDAIGKFDAKVLTLKDYLRNAMILKATEGLKVSSTDCVGNYIMCMARTCKAENAKLSAVDVYRLSKAGVVPKVSTQELLTSSIARSKGRCLEAYQSFVGDALDSGYDMDVVRSFVKNDIKLNGRPEFSPAFDVIEQQRAGVYYSYLVSKVESSSPGWEKQAVSIEVQTPGGRFRDSVEKHNSLGLQPEQSQGGQELEGPTVVSRSDVTSGRLPQGFTGGMTDRGVPYVSYRGISRDVPEDGLVLVKERNRDRVKMYDRKSFNLIYGADTEPGRKVSQAKQKKPSRGRKKNF